MCRSCSWGCGKGRIRRKDNGTGERGSGGLVAGKDRKPCDSSFSCFSFFWKVRGKICPWERADRETRRVLEAEEGQYEEQKGRAM